MSKIAGIYWDDTAAAPGISLSVYFSGCYFNCPGCHNPEAWDFNYGEDFTPELFNEILEKLQKNGVERRLSILGGEPLCDGNIAAVTTLIEAVKCYYPNTLVYVWTGYTYEELLERSKDNELIKHLLDVSVDVLIDGRFEIDKRDTTLPLRGSSNQRIINLKELRNGNNDYRNTTNADSGNC